MNYGPADCRTRKVQLQYQDDENEWVTFSSDEELRCALSLLETCPGPKLLRLRLNAVEAPPVIPLVPLVPVVQTAPAEEDMSDEEILPNYERGRVRRRGRGRGREGGEGERFGRGRRGRIREGPENGEGHSFIKVSIPLSNLNFTRKNSSMPASLHIQHFQTIQQLLHPLKLLKRGHCTIQVSSVLLQAKLRKVK